jgi:hypothetical protein
VVFSKIATEVSSQLVSMARVIKRRQVLFFGKQSDRTRVKPCEKTGRSHMDPGSVATRMAVVEGEGDDPKERIADQGSRRLGDVAAVAISLTCALEPQQ